jgi:endo-1,4-beta-xylanase
MKNKMIRLTDYRFRFTGILFITILFISCKKSASQNAVITDTVKVTTVLPDEQPFTLKSVAGFDVGVEDDYNVYNANDAVKKLIVKEYDRLTTEAMKMDYAQLDFTNDVNNPIGELFINSLKKDLDFAAANGLKVHGHTLLYWASSPGWFRNIATKDSLEYYSKKFIKGIVRASVGKVGSIDVVNELFNTADGGISANNTSNNIYNTWFKLYNYNRIDFYNFIGRCFTWAREEDDLLRGSNPRIKLFYNDYNHEIYAEKRDSIFSLCLFLKNNNYPVDGIGMQFHLRILPSFFPPNFTTQVATFQGITDAIDLAKNLTASNGEKFLIHISELDVALDETVQPITATPAPYLLQNQWKQYDVIRHLVSAFKNIPAQQQWGITLWNSSDLNTWYRSYLLDYDYPTMFDEKQNRKLMYYGFLSGASAEGDFYLQARIFHLYNMQTGKYAEAANNTTANGVLLQQNNYSNAKTQLFRFIRNADGSYHIVNENSLKSFDHYTTAPFSLQQYTYGANPNQQFKVAGAPAGIADGRFSIISKANGYYVQVKDAALNTAATLQVGIANNTNLNQQWKLVD